MKTRRILPFAASVLALSLLAACGNSTSPEADEPTRPSPSPSTTEEQILEEEAEAAAPRPLDGTWTAYTYDGAVVELTFDVPADDPRVAALEGYRSAVNGEPASYAVATIDNRQGAALVNMYSTSLYDADGVKYEFTGATEYLDDQWQLGTEWNDDYTDYTDTDAAGRPLTSEEKLDLQAQREALDLTTAVDPSAKDDMILVGPTALPDEVASVTVEASGAGEAVPAVHESETPQ